MSYSGVTYSPIAVNMDDDDNDDKYIPNNNNNNNMLLDDSDYEDDHDECSFGDDSGGGEGRRGGSVSKNEDNTTTAIQESSDSQQQQPTRQIPASHRNNNTAKSNLIMAITVVVSIIFAFILLLLVKMKALYNLPAPTHCVPIPEIDTAGLSGLKSFQMRFNGVWDRLHITDVSTNVIKPVGSMKARKLRVPTIVDLMDEDGVGGYTYAVFRSKSWIPVYRCADRRYPIGYLSMSVPSFAAATFTDHLEFSLYNARRELIARTNRISMKDIYVDTSKPLQLTLTDYTVEKEKQSTTILAILTRSHSSKYKKAVWDIKVQDRPSTENASPIATFAMFIVSLADYYHLS